VSKLRVLDLFSGIGGFSLGLERTGGFETVAFCEINEFCRRVLAKHWPEVPCYEDVCTLNADTLARDGIGIDVICGGFPCQDISIAGQGAGLEGERSGLWFQYARLIGELRPSYVLVENVGALLHRGLDAVLGGLAALGYDAEWHCIPASAVGAPHERDRVWIVAYADKGNEHGRNSALQVGRLPLAREIADDGYARRAQWGSEPCLGRVAHGVSNRVDRVGSLGNAVVPQIPELIGRAILEARSAA
jgi:DNA (cytosine-5)-methyltransferase 1